MCAAKRGQQAKRMDVKTFKRRLGDEEEMFELTKGARALLADPLPVGIVFRIVFGISFFFGTIGSLVRWTYLWQLKQPHLSHI